MQSVSALAKTRPVRKNEEIPSPSEIRVPIAPTYLQNCPVCGRPLEIRAEYRGHKLNCRHCGGKFTAIDPSSPAYAAQNTASALLRRAEKLLDLSARKIRLRSAG